MDWQQIDAIINGDWTTRDIQHLCRQLLDVDAASVEKCKSGGNAGVFRLMLHDQSCAKVKIYPVDASHDRLLSELTATKGLMRLGTRVSALPLAHDAQLGVGIFEWIEGQPVTAPNLRDVQSALDFLEGLHGLKDSPAFHDAPMASAACISGRDIEMQIRRRISEFEQPRAMHSTLDQFFKLKLLPTLDSLMNWAHGHWPENSVFDKPLAREELTLSPSDFGFHNALRRPDGTLVFLDFEYFGWDDPVKLISDFSFHPGMALSDEKMEMWIQGALKIYGNHLNDRLTVSRPLYGLIWCLILLNDYRPEIWQRRLLANESRRDQQREICELQLARALSLLRSVRKIQENAFAETFYS
jgi:hypothetical protein